MSNCDLCEIYEEDNRITEVYYEDEDLVILNCLTCQDPMVVVKDHTMSISFELANYILGTVRMQFNGAVDIRFNQRKVPNHLHWHIEV